MADTVKGPGRPKGSTIDDADSQIDVLIMRRQEAQQQAREDADVRARYRFKQWERRAQRRQAWIDYHDKQSHIHQGLADEHYHAAAQLRRSQEGA